MTGPTMRFGVAVDFAPAGGGGYKDRLAQLEPLLDTIAAAGYHSLSAGESYVFDPADPMGFHSPNALLSLTAVAAQVPSIRLVAGVCLLAGWDPRRLAYDTALVDQISGGRLTLGLGLGSPTAWRAFGLIPEELPERLATTVGVLRSAWRGRIEAGEQALTFWPRPVQAGGPPILIGGARAASARRAADLADGFVASSGYTLDLIRRQVGRYRDALGDRPGHVSLNRFTVVAETEQRALELFTRHVAPLVTAYRNSRLVGDQGRPPADASDLCLIGSPDRVADLVAGYAAAGVDELQLRVVAGGLPIPAAQRSLELFAAEVRPRFATREVSA